MYGLFVKKQKKSKKKSVFTKHKKKFTVSYYLRIFAKALVNEVNSLKNPAKPAKP